MAFLKAIDYGVTTTEQNGNVASGFYGTIGAYMYVRLLNSCQYIYVGSSTTGTFYRKTIERAELYEGNIEYSDFVIKIDPDTSTQSDKTFYVFGSSEDLGNPADEIPSSSDMLKMIVPKFAFTYYNASSDLIIVSGNGTTIYPSCEQDSSATFIGFTSSSSSYSPTYETLSGGFYIGSTSSYGFDFNGKTLYAIYEKADSTKTTNYNYYLGNSSKAGTISKKVTTSGIILYGTGSSTSGTTSTSWSGAPSTADYDSSYKFSGWAKSSTATAYYSTDYKTTCNASSGTIYAIYKKTESMTYYPNNGESTKSISVTNYRHGPGYVTSNIPIEPSLTYDGYEFNNWATTLNGTPDTWENQWNNGVRTVYAVWTGIGSIYFGVGDNWVAAYAYKGTIVDGVLTWVSISVDDLMKYVN